MRMRFAFCLLGLLISLDATQPLLALNRQESHELMRDLVMSQPENKDILFIHLLFSHRDICLDEEDVTSFEKQVRRLSDRKFTKRFGGEATTRSWLLQILDELGTYHSSKKDLLKELAVKMGGPSLILNDTLTQMHNWKLLFLIQYASQKPQNQVLTRRPERIDMAQLLEVLRAEQNSRV